MHILTLTMPSSDFVKFMTVPIMTHKFKIMLATMCQLCGNYTLWYGVNSLKWGQWQIVQMRTSKSELDKMGLYWKIC